MNHQNACKISIEIDARSGTPVETNYDSFVARRQRMALAHLPGFRPIDENLCKATMTLEPPRIHAHNDFFTVEKLIALEAARIEKIGEGLGDVFALTNFGSPWGTKTMVINFTHLMEYFQNPQSVVGYNPALLKYIPVFDFHHLVEGRVGRYAFFNPVQRRNHFDFVMSEFSTYSVFRFSHGHNWSTYAHQAESNGQGQRTEADNDYMLGKDDTYPVEITDESGQVHEVNVSNRAELLVHHLTGGVYGLQTTKGGSTIGIQPFLIGYIPPSTMTASNAVVPYLV